MVVAVVAAGVLAPQVAARSRPGPPASAVQQYVEEVPTAKGPSSPGTGEQTTTPLSPTAKRALSRTAPATAAALRRIATSSAYGAPSSGSSTAAQGPGLASATGAASDARLVLLVVALAAITSLGIAFALRRPGRYE